jgi:hypothetical protein
MWFLGQRLGQQRCMPSCRFQHIKPHVPRHHNQFRHFVDCAMHCRLVPGAIADRSERLSAQSSNDNVKLNPSSLLRFVSSRRGQKGLRAFLCLNCNSRDYIKGTSTSIQHCIEHVQSDSDALQFAIAQSTTEFECG